MTVGFLWIEIEKGHMPSYHNFDSWAYDGIRNVPLLNEGEGCHESSVRFNKVKG